MKCNAGIWIDCKQLLEHTRRLVGAFSDFDREVFGKELVRLNVAMVADFALAYRLRDEHYIYDGPRAVRDICVSGNKREYLDSIHRKDITKDYDNHKILIKLKNV